MEATIIIMHSTLKQNEICIQTEYSMKLYSDFLCVWYESITKILK